MNHSPTWLTTCLKYVNSYKELSEVLGVDRSTIARWRQGNRKMPRADLIHKMEKLTKGEVSFSDFLIK